jgi:hypothetical protein
MEVSEATSPCPAPLPTTSSWTGPARSADGRAPKFNPTIPAPGFAFWITTTRRLEYKRRFPAPNWTARCTSAPPRGSGCADLKPGWQSSGSCPSSDGSAGWRGCPQCVGSARPCTGLSQITDTVFLARPRDARLIRARPLVKTTTEAGIPEIASSPSLCILGAQAGTGQTESPGRDTSRGNVSRGPCFGPDALREFGGTMPPQQSHDGRAK